MEKQFVHTINGRSVQQAELNAMGESAGLADDRVFAELLRMPPYDGSTVRKGILHFGHETSGNTALVAPNGGTGSVLVNPFRAFVGSRTAVATNAKKNWRDIRSAIAVGSTTLGQSVSLGENASGNPRWALVYAIVTPDVAGAGQNRKFKDTTSKVISTAFVPIWNETTVTLAVQAGTAAASPVWPSVPADTATTFHVPIAYVRVPNGFGSGSTVGPGDIAVVAPVLRLANASGSVSLEPGDNHYTAGSSGLTTAAIQAWGATGTKPAVFLPSTLSGGTSLLLAVDLSTGALSHADGAILDSRDWRGRLVKWTAVVGGTGTGFAWTAGGFTSPNGGDTLSSGTRQSSSGIGETCSAGSSLQILSLSGSELAIMDDLAFVSLVYNGSGQIVLDYSGAPDCTVLFWLEFSGRIDNETG